MLLKCDLIHIWRMKELCKQWRIQEFSKRVQDSQKFLKRVQDFSLLLFSLKYCDWFLKNPNPEKKK